MPPILVVCVSCRDVRRVSSPRLGRRLHKAVAAGRRRGGPVMAVKVKVAVVTMRVGGQGAMAIAATLTKQTNPRHAVQESTGRRGL